MAQNDTETTTDAQWHRLSEEYVTPHERLTAEDDVFPEELIDRVAHMMRYHEEQPRVSIEDGDLPMTQRSAGRNLLHLSRCEDLVAYFAEGEYLEIDLFVRGHESAPFDMVGYNYQIQLNDDSSIVVVHVDNSTFDVEE